MRGWSAGCATGRALIWIKHAAPDRPTVQTFNRKENMVQTRASVLGAFAAVLLAVPAKAQVLVDVSKISCDQYITQRITHMQTVNVWLAGFYAGRRNNPVVDTQALNRNGNKLSRFCESHREMPLLDAVEANTK
ncbi:hypothetical protein JQ580_06240 [Bradyrhizobium japonicum]|nr:hypothetical protein [Bradyrhizobium japonicum]